MFKAGDKVLCIDTSKSGNPGLENNILYTVKNYYIHETLGPMITLQNREGGYFASRFEKYIEEKQIDLMSCPFCNSIDLTSNKLFESCWVSCNNCETEGPISTNINEAKKKWNKRLTT